jgi:hypothetical protein
LQGIERSVEKARTEKARAEDLRAGLARHRAEAERVLKLAAAPELQGALDEAFAEEARAVAARLAELGSLQPWVVRERQADVDSALRRLASLREEISAVQAKGEQTAALEPRREARPDAGRPAASGGPVECRSPETRQLVRTAVQGRLASMGRSQEYPLFEHLSKLDKATSAVSQAIARDLGRNAGIPADDLTICEVEIGLDAPIFISVFARNPYTGGMGGAVLNYGFPGEAAPLGESEE